MSRPYSAAAVLAFALPVMLWANAVWLQSGSAQPPIRIPSNVAWTEETIAAASSGDPVRGLIVARRCERCHGVEGFSSLPFFPNLAAIDKLTMWKQLEDFRSGKRNSPIMQPIAAALSSHESADLAAYYAILPNGPDPQDNRTFPTPAPSGSHVGIAARLVTFGDARRGVPPCQACHGPVGYVKGAPSLATQNGAYILKQLNAFAGWSRTNDINVVMRSIASQLTVDEKQALGEYYGAGYATRRSSE